MKEQWIRNLRDRLGDSRKKAPEGLLDDIKREMARRGVSPMPAPSRPQKHFPARIAALAASVAAVGLTLLMVTLMSLLMVTLMPDSRSLPTDGDVATTAPQPVIRTGSASSNVSTLSRPSAALVARLSGPPHSAASSPLSATSFEAVTETEENSQPQVPPSQNPERHNDKQPLPESASRQPVPAHRDSRPPSASAYSPMALGQRQERERNRRATRIDAFYSGMATDYRGAANTERLSAFDVQDTPSSTDNPEYMVSVRDYAPSTPTIEAHHRQPVKVGVTVAYGLNDRWSLHTGLVYSYHSSDITRDNGIDTHSSHQRLYFVGVPVGVGYRVWQGSRVGVYATAGVTAEKMVSGKAKTLHKVLGQEPTFTEERVKMRELQLSADAALGVEYRVADHIGFYAEPGVGYYFRNGSDVETIYRQKPLGFNFNVGLRIALGK